MGLFDFFSRKDTSNDSYDPTAITVHDLEVGFIFDYNLSHWKITETAVYDWGDQCYSKVFRIEDEKDIQYLNVETEDGLELGIFQKIEIATLDTDVIGHYRAHQGVPNQIRYKNESYRLEEQCPGYMQSRTEHHTQESWTELMCFDYQSQSGKLLSLEQWGELEFTVTVGKAIKEYEVSNITPSESYQPVKKKR